MHTHKSTCTCITGMLNVVAFCNVWKSSFEGAFTQIHWLRNFGISVHNLIMCTYIPSY